ncbi:hypothetical protein NCS52_00252700 [Fusarium sp. LHS14.1]|nr:hypothetical protein NCS52_00252700 [Fusarium sp. LHS14.1]
MVGIVQLTGVIAAIAGAASAVSPLTLAHPQCDQFVYGESCQAFTSRFGLSQQAFLNLNPNLNPTTGCNQLPASWYCVRTRAPGAPISTPSPASTAMFGNCAKFAAGFKTQGGSCWDIAAAFELSQSDWRYLNPDVPSWDGWKCFSLINDHYCVELKQETPPPPITSTSTTTTARPATTTTKPKTTTTKRRTTSTRRPRFHKD